MISSHSADRVMHFNSHAHVERDRPNVMEIIITHDFNSHAHVERDSLQIILIDGAEISTHTLTWSVTVRVGAIPTRNSISTHTLTWSVTLLLYIPL